MFIIAFLIFLTVLANPGFAQVTDSLALMPPDEAGEIKATVQVDRHEVPLNQTLTYTVRISWQGDLERYEVEKLENPLLTNLEIVGNSSSNRAGEVDGVKQTTKKYELILKPQALGMAYIDGAIIDYKDRIEGESHSLVTSRLEVKVIDPVLKTDFGGVFLLGGTVLLLALIAGFGLFFVKRKRQKQAALAALAADEEPLETRYLSELKESIDLVQQAGGDTFSELSKILRRYLSEKYGVSALGSTTPEICEALQTMTVDEQVVGNTEEVLNTCDVAKFSGGQAVTGTPERVYTLLEELLIRNKTNEMETVERSGKQSHQT